jgi:hypothetical protein
MYTLYSVQKCGSILKLYGGEFFTCLKKYRKLQKRFLLFYFRFVFVEMSDY